MVSNSFIPLKELWYVSSHHPELVFGNPFKCINTKASLININVHFVFAFFFFFLHTKPKSFLETEKHDDWILVTQEELNQFEKNDVGELVPSNVDEHRTIVRNKARLVDKSYIQDKDIDYEKIFASVVRLESIKMFLVYLLCQLYNFLNWY